MQTTIYQIQLPQFEGPFDLLLFFIQRDELNIYDIPISKITHDFLEYIHHLEELEIDIASEFILMAASLMKIKAAMLLPRQQINEKGEAIDPRTELVDRLVEFQKYKKAQEELQILEEKQLNCLIRRGIETEIQQLSQQITPQEEMVGLNLYQILKTYHKVLQNHISQTAKPKHVIQKYPYTLEEVKLQILDEIRQFRRLDFITFVTMHPEKLYVVFSVLAILELIQQKLLKVILGEGYNNFWMTSLDYQETELVIN